MLLSCCTICSHCCLCFVARRSQSQALAHSFSHVLLSRLALGVTESLAAPASYSLIAAYFPLSERGFANGVYACGIYIGGGLASLSIVIARAYGWRATCVIVGCIGICLGFLFAATVAEPAVFVQQLQREPSRTLDRVASGVVIMDEASLEGSVSSF